MSILSPLSALAAVGSAVALLCACASDDGQQTTSGGGSSSTWPPTTGGAASAATGGSSLGVAGATGGSPGSTAGGPTGGTPGGGGSAAGGSPPVATGGVATGGNPSPSSGGLSGGGTAGTPPGSGGALATAGTLAGGASAGGQTAAGGTAGSGGQIAAAGAAGSGGQTATAGAAGNGGQTATGGAASGGTTSALPPTDDYDAPGPFETTTDRDVGPEGHATIFRPTTLGEGGFLHAPIIFGPGINMQAMQMQQMLLSFASHGFVVVGTGVLSGGPNDPGNLATMVNALNWIIEQNDQPGLYQGVLAVDRAIAMGYSVGGTAAVELGGQDAIATVVSIHGHIAEAALHGPMLQTSGTNDTVGLPMQEQTYASSQVQTFLATVDGADHGYVGANQGGVERPAIIAWMRYWIYGDNGARGYFWGEDCVLCAAPWTNPQRKNWE